MLHRKVRLYATYFIIIMKIRHNIIFSNHWLISGTVRTVCVCIFAVIGLSSASAQIYSTAQRSTPYNSYSNETYGSLYNSTTDMQQAQPTYNSYQSTVYQPFESSVPSDNNPVYSNSPGNNDRHNAPTNRRNLTGGGDAGSQEPTSPIGEGWVMLFFAAVAALVVFVRQRKAAVRGESPTSNSQ